MAERREPTPSHHSASSDSDSEPAVCSGSMDSSQSKGNLQDMWPLVDQYCDTDVLSSEAIQLLSTIPDGYIPVPHQMGGHKHVNGKPGFLRNIEKPEFLYKPMQPHPKGARELNFYNLFLGADLSSDLMEMRKFLPKYYGKQVIPQKGGGDSISEYFCLEDCTHPFKRPCIMDLKIGKKVCEQGSDENKIIRAKEKYPVQETIGFRIVGMRVYKCIIDEFKYYNRSYGMTRLDKDSVHQGMVDFLDNGTEIRYDLLPVILEKVNEIKDWFATQATFKLFATSILLIYEGSQGPGVKGSRVDIRLVDFAHAYFSSEVDDLGPNCLFGVEQVLDHFKLIMEGHF